MPERHKVLGIAKSCKNKVTRMAIISAVSPTEGQRVSTRPKRPSQVPGPAAKLEFLCEECCGRKYPARDRRGNEPKSPLKVSSDGIEVVDVRLCSLGEDWAGWYGCGHSADTEVTVTRREFV